MVNMKMKPRRIQLDSRLPWFSRSIWAARNRQVGGRQEEGETRAASWAQDGPCARGRYIALHGDLCLSYSVLWILRAASLFWGLLEKQQGRGRMAT